MLSKSTLEINSENLIHNLRYYRSILNDSTKIMVMVKAFGYGLGNPGAAKILESGGVEYLGVAYTHEGVGLRKAGITQPIMVMNPHAADLELLVEYDLEAEVFSLKLLQIFDTYTREKKSRLSIHLKVETGMQRLGFEKENIPALIRILKDNNYLKVQGILSHLSSADMPGEKKFTQAQATEFQALSSRITNELGYKPLRHLLNSAGALNYTEYQFEMVRLGIGIYGVNRGFEAHKELKPVCSLKSIISQIKVLKKGDSIGYSRAGKVEKEYMTIGTVGMGYADGIFRILGNGRLHVIINGNSAPTVGNICMDMFMIDITGIDASEGDEVEIFGTNQPVERVAEAANTIPYEIFTSVGERVERAFI